MASKSSFSFIFLILCLPVFVAKCIELINIFVFLVVDTLGLLVF